MSRSRATGINERGDVSGVRSTAAGQRPILWAGGQAPAELALLAGHTTGEANAINARGDVVGYSADASGARRATLWPSERRGRRSRHAAGRGLQPGIRQQWCGRHRRRLHQHCRQPRRAVDARRRAGPEQSYCAVALRADQGGRHQQPAARSSPSGMCQRPGITQRPGRPAERTSMTWMSTTFRSGSSCSFAREARRDVTQTCCRRAVMPVGHSILPLAERCERAGQRHGPVDPIAELAGNTHPQPPAPKRQSHDVGPPRQPGDTCGIPPPRRSPRCRMQAMTCSARATPSWRTDGCWWPAGISLDNVGLANASVYDPATNTWSRAPDMNAGRWYPTVTTLPNGDALVMSGQIDTTVGLNPLPQVYQAATNTWRGLDECADGPALYPMMFVAPNGKVIMVGPVGQHPLAGHRRHRLMDVGGPAQVRLSRLRFGCHVRRRENTGDGRRRIRLDRWRK